MTQFNFNNSWHVYGLTNELLGEVVRERTQITTLFSTGIADDGSRIAAGDPDPHFLLTQSPHSTPPPPDIAATNDGQSPGLVGK